MPSNNDKVTLIRREIYIVDDLFAKALIKIDIMKPKNIILDTFKNLAIIKFYEGLRVPISIIIKDSRINISIISEANHSVLAYFYIIVLIKHITLLEDRNLIFKPKQLEELTLFAHIVNHNISHILIRNNTDISIILFRRSRLD